MHRCSKIINGECCGCFKNHLNFNYKVRRCQETILTSFAQKILIDEVQRVPKLLDIVHTVPKLMCNMTQHNDMIRLRHMLDHANEAVDLITGKEEIELQDNRVLELALIRLVEIAGEASANVSSEMQAKYPSIPWQQVIGSATG